MNDPQVHVGEIISGSKITAEVVDAIEGNEPIDIEWTAEQINPPLRLQSYPGLESALRDGDRLHAFMSGGGLRVVYIADAGEGECSGNDKAYGEHPNIEEALRICEEDHQAGCRPYHEVYGKLYPHFYTGSSQASSNLDLWIRQGRSFDVMMESGSFTFKSSYSWDRLVPEQIRDQVVEAYKKREFYRHLHYRAGSNRRRNKARHEYDKHLAMCKVQYAFDDGVIVECTPFVFANGKIGTSAKVIKCPEGMTNTWSIEREVKVSGGKTLLDLFNKVNQWIGRHNKLPRT